MLILGTEYGLIRDDETLEETLHDGECAIYTKLIKIRAMEKMLEPSASEEDKRTRYNEVLRHEVIHAFLMSVDLRNTVMMNSWYSGLRYSSRKS